jgi:uncharacterized protein
MKRKLRVIVDTNVVISGLISKSSYPARIIDAWLAGKFIPVISKNLQEEINDVLRRSKITKLNLCNPKDVKKILALLFNSAEKIKPRKQKINIDLDEKDHFLLELAISSGVNIIVSGDEEILACSYKGLIFLSPKDFSAKFL